MRSGRKNLYEAAALPPVGAGLLAKAVVQAMKMLAGPTPSRASSLPQWNGGVAYKVATTVLIGLF